jgi:glucose 1-dehydrogenase
MTLDDWREVIELDLTDQFLCCRETVRRFRAQGSAGRPFRSAGSIISMSSVYERIPGAGHINYSAAKGGVRMLAQTLAQEVAADRIRVNAVAPGAVRTPINKKAWDTDEVLRKLLELIPMAGSASPRTSRRQSPWPASDETDHVTGATLFVDGGMTLYPGFLGNG